MRMEDEVGVCNITRADRSLPQVCGHPRRLSPGCQGSSSRFYPSSCRSCRWDQSVWEIVASLASALDVAVESRWTDKKERRRWTTDDKVEDCPSVLTRCAQGSLARSLLLSVCTCTVCSQWLNLQQGHRPNVQLWRFAPAQINQPASTTISSWGLNQLNLPPKFVQYSVVLMIHFWLNLVFSVYYFYFYLSVSLLPQSFSIYLLYTFSYSWLADMNFAFSWFLTHSRTQPSERSLAQQ